VNSSLHRYTTIQTMKSAEYLAEGSWAETVGFHSPGDGGGALYRVGTSGEADGASRIALDNGLCAALVENEAVNYRMFGAVSDGEQDDGVQIKCAHEYANNHGIPVINLSGEFWIKQTNDIPITTNVNWGQTTFHIDEKENSKTAPRFVVQNDRPTITVELDEGLKEVLLEKIRPGVQIIPELAKYAGHLISVEDADDRIGIRAGNYSKAGWAREELFYVEEEGRIVGDIAWRFKDFTSVTAKPCSDSYLIVEGGGFYFSGDNPADGDQGYHHHGIVVERSRTIIRQQWMGLETGRSDDSMEPRRGFYVLNGVYDVTLENIRAMPWEKNRVEEGRVLRAGTYGIGGARMLNCKFRNLTAEGGWVAWGVFGTNLNKNFRVEDCRLNRIDVHFHCWNLYISNCTIGFKGISVTGGGDLFIDNTVRHGTTFVSFRPDYGAKWDGHVRIRGCTFKPSGDQTTAVLSYRPQDFDYQYSIGYARSITIEDMLIDYDAAPESVAPCWLMQTVPFSKTSDGTRLFFPNRITFRNVAVEGREQGVRLFYVPSPGQYDMRKTGAYDGGQLVPNCDIVCDSVDLEDLQPENPQDRENVHLLIGGDDTTYIDSSALYARVRFTNCNNVCASFGDAMVSAFFDRCTVNVLHAPGMRGELVLDDCHLRPSVRQSYGDFYAVDTTVGTRFTNCTVHAPIVDGTVEPGMVDATGFVEINGSVKHYHLNTALGNEVLKHCEESGMALSPEFISKLKSHHALEA
jgi:hypothetical protein